MKQKQIPWKLIQTPKVRLKGTPWTRSPRHHSAPKSKVHRRAICQDPMQLPRPQCCDAVATGASQVPPTASRRRLSAAPRRESSTHPEKKCISQSSSCLKRFCLQQSWLWRTQKTRNYNYWAIFFHWKFQFVPILHELSQAQDSRVWLHIQLGILTVQRPNGDAHGPRR